MRWWSGEEIGGHTGVHRDEEAMVAAFVNSAAMARGVYADDLSENVAMRIAEELSHGEKELRRGGRRNWHPAHPSPAECLPMKFPASFTIFDDIFGGDRKLVRHKSKGHETRGGYSTSGYYLYGTNKGATDCLTPIPSYSEKKWQMANVHITIDGSLPVDGDGYVVASSFHVTIKFGGTLLMKGLDNPEIKYFFTEDQLNGKIVKEKGKTMKDGFEKKADKTLIVPAIVKIHPYTHLPLPPVCQDPPKSLRWKSTEVKQIATTIAERVYAACK